MLTNYCFLLWRPTICSGSIIRDLDDDLRWYEDIVFVGEAKKDMMDRLTVCCTIVRPDTRRHSYLLVVHSDYQSDKIQHTYNISLR